MHNDIQHIQEKMAADIEPQLSACIKAVRHFNRLYAAKAGAFNEKIFGSDLSLTEVRVIYELSVHSPTNATFLSKSLALDCGYLSRILNRFEKDGLIMKERSLKDARQRTISLTKKGVKLATDISQAADQSVYTILQPLTREQQVAITSAMGSILGILGLNPTP